jgi:serine/threonine protein kinase
MLYIIMEYVKGNWLHHSAHGKAISQSVAVDIISAVCSGLNHAHDAGFMIRDIKPANILLGKRATPKIGDFGIARLNGMTESGVICGLYLEISVVKSINDEARIIVNTTDDCEGYFR